MHFVLCSQPASSHMLAWGTAASWLHSRALRDLFSSVVVVKSLFLWINKGWELTDCHLADFTSLLFHFLNVSLINQVDFSNFSRFRFHGAKTPCLCEVSGKEFIKPRRQLTSAGEAAGLSTMQDNAEVPVYKCPALRVPLYLPTVWTSISSSFRIKTTKLRSWDFCDNGSVK